MVFLGYIFLIFALLLAFAGFIYIIILFFGPPFVPTPQRTVKEIIEAVHLSRKDIVIDLGSGDGRVLIAAARRGALAGGWEINPFLVLWTNLLCRCYGVKNKVKVYATDYMTADLRDATVVFLYNLPQFLPKIEKKLQKELKNGTRIVTYKFQMQSFKPKKEINGNIFIYSV